MFLNGRFSARAGSRLALLACLLLSPMLFLSKPQSTFAATNLALGKTALASSSENAATAANFAVDGNVDTRWSSSFADGQWLRVDLGSVQSFNRIVLRWEAAYATSYRIQISNDAATWTTIQTITNSDGNLDDLSISGTGRYLRVEGITRATAYGISLFEFEVYGAANSSNLALNTITLASSSENMATAANFAVDGNVDTRWSSSFADGQWLRVDLGSVQSFNRIVLRWEAAYASSYRIQSSNDAATWTTIQTISNSDGNLDDLSITGTGRYLRVEGITRATQYGISLFEVEVYSGSIQPTVQPTAQPTAQPTSIPNSCPTSSNIALNKPAYAWFYESKTSTPAQAVDGNATTTRWSHLWYPSGPANAWLYVDLGSTNATINRVRILWEAAYAADYQIQISNDRSNWTNLRSVVGNTQTSNDYNLTPVTGRYLRINMTKKATEYGYSIWELEVYGCNAGNPSYDPAPAPLTGSYSRVWVENFDGNSLNMSNWAYDNDVHVNGEQQQYTSNNVAVSGGTLKITARKETANGYPFTSGRIFGLGRQSFLYGKMVARMKMPVGEGYWPAFWMMGANINEVGWPGNGELDIMENIGYGNWTSGALHGPGYWGAGSAGGLVNLPAGQTTGDWHTYAVEWDPTFIKWFVDDREILSFTRAQIIADYGQWTYDNPKFFILNLALGGEYPAGYNGCTGNPLPAGCAYFGLKQSTVDSIVAGNGLLEVDYVEVWQKPASAAQYLPLAQQSK
ncbi:discoidin domain-containing protein [Herpetosiphon llansteffanensis]|uniref:discoidin domain-containing protein n=1 Tax=Herpetosiphon llansteffanensis TaxID=2094568 RepID=UPI000D7BAE8C|nr:discoidin domain-containing protein [Herpetosiphon llansteffanensis]